MDDFFSNTLEFLDVAEYLLYIFIIGCVLFIIIIYTTANLFINYSDFFKSSKVRKKFFNDIKGAIKERFTTKREETFRILFFTVLIIACLWFAVHFS